MGVVAVEIEPADGRGDRVDECEDIDDRERGNGASGGRWRSFGETKSRFGSLKHHNQTLFRGTL